MKNCLAAGLSVLALIVSTAATAEDRNWGLQDVLAIARSEASKGNEDAKAFVEVLVLKSDPKTADKPIDPKLAQAGARWIDDAAGRGIPAAQYAKALQLAIGAKPDLAAAHEWCLKAAKLGYRPAQNCVASAYWNGSGVTKDRSKAIGWATKAAEAGDPDMQRLVGAAYLSGDGVAADGAKGVAWLEKAASQGDTRSTSLLADVYRVSNYVPADAKKAMYWRNRLYGKGPDAANDAKVLLVLANRSDLDAQWRIGMFYASGAGVPKDEPKAVEWYTKAASKGHGNAQASLGLMYFYGRGAAKDDAQALRWYRASADQGNARGRSGLAYLYASGRGVARDDIAAVRLYRLAAGQDDPDAQNALGQMYEQGRGGLKADRSAAFEYYRKAAAQGHPLAIEHLKKLAASTSPSPARTK